MERIEANHEGPEHLPFINQQRTFNRTQIAASINRATVYTTFDEQS